VGIVTEDALKLEQLERQLQHQPVVTGEIDPGQLGDPPQPPTSGSSGG